MSAIAQATIEQKIKFLTLAQADSLKGASLYVCNRTKPRGNVNLQVGNGMGGVTVVKIPVTWVPFDVSHLAPKDAVLNNPSFRRMVSAGFLRVVDPSCMDAILAYSAVREEVARVSSSAVDMSSLSEDVAENTPVEVQQMEDLVDVDVSGVVHGVLTQEDLTGSQAVSILRGQEDILTEADLNYLIANSTLAEVKEYAASVLVARESAA